MALVPWPRVETPSPPQLRAFPGSAGSGLSSVRPDGSLGAILDDFDGRWDRGESPCAEDYLDGLDADGAVELIYHEFCRHESSDRAPRPVDFLERFPGHRSRLARVFGLHEAFDPRVAGPLDLDALPRAGDEIGPYRLLRELGRGSFARVFLAEQADLEHRLVVVKVSARPSPEPWLLARVQHPHIAGVLRYVEADAGTLHLVCMPFRGGATLSEVFAEGRRRGGRARSGRELLDALDRASAPEYRAAGSRRGASRELLAALSHAKAVSWLVARLAEALEHAHRRGVSHGDIKPSNVLLAADGGPMLLDFNLALDWSDPGDAGGSSERGGTLAYMAPERLRALASPRELEPFPTPLARHRADLYGLGLILVEGLGIPLPEVIPAGASSHRDLAARLAESRGPMATARLLRRVPGGLRPIVARCLAPDPANRYGHAGELAEDLDRYRDDLPPAFARAPGGLDALGRRVRRRRRAFAALALAAVVGVGAGAGASRHFASPLQGLAREKLDALWGGGEPDVYLLRRLGGYREPGIAAAAASRALRNLARYDVLGPGDWRDRDDVRFLPDDEREDLHLWLLEQAWRHASAVASRRDSAASELQQARLALSRMHPGPWPAPLDDLDRRLQRRLGSGGTGGERPGTTMPGWMAAYLRGVSLEDDRPAEALGHYRAALAERPGSFWAHYRAAFASWKARDYRAAAASLRRCVDRRPGNPRLRVAQAGLYCYLGRPDLAHEPLPRAVRIDPDSADAYRTFAFARLGLGQREQLENDFMRFDQLEQAQGLQDSWASHQDARRLLASPDRPPPPPPEPVMLRLRASAEEDVDARIFLACCLGDSGDDQEALEQARRALDEEPDHIVALLTYALLLQKVGDPGAVNALRRLTDHPRFEDVTADDEQTLQVYRYLASDLLMYGRIGDSREALSRGLEQLSCLFGGDRADRAEIRRLRGLFHYSLARVDAAESSSRPERAGDAEGHLREALEHLPGEVPSWYRGDAIFGPLRTRLDALPGLGDAPDPGPREGA